MDENERKEFLFKEIDIVQAVIKRLANNSFLIKGWMITVVVVTLLLKCTTNLPFLALIPLFMFWLLDAYFLKQERMYRELYKWVVENRLSSDENMLDMNADRFEKNVASIPKTMLSKTLSMFYGFVLALVIIYEVILLSNIDNM